MESEGSVCCECSDPIALGDDETCHWCAAGPFCSDCIFPGSHAGCNQADPGLDGDMGTEVLDEEPVPPELKSR